MSAQADERFREALSHYRAGRPDTAARICRQILEADAGHPHAARLLAMILAESGREAEAIRLLEGLARGAGAPSSVLYTLGRMQAQSGAYAQALASLERAHGIAPEDPAISRALGYCLARLGRPNEAARTYENALRLRPDEPAMLRDYGEILAGLARFDAAIEAYQRLRELDPGNSLAHARLAGLYERTNRLDDMAEVIESGLHAWPEDPALRFQRAVCLRRRDEPEPALAILEQLQREDLDADLSRRAAFEAARLLDRLGRYDRAFDQARHGNRLASGLARRAAGGSESYGDWLDRVFQTLTSAPTTGGVSAPKTSDSDDPVFILGFPRSGTTLLDVLLTGLDEFQVYEEKPFAGELFDELARHGHAYPDCGPNLEPGLVAALRRRYHRAAERYQERRPGTVIVDKNPLATPVVPLLHQLFPRARYIFAVRHPLDVCLSCYLYSFSPNAALAECETVDQIAALYAKTTQIWREARRRLPLEAIEVSYEAMVEDLASESRRLFDFLGLEWDDDVLEFGERARAGAPTLRNYDRVIQGIYRTSRYRWRHYERHLAGAAPVVREAAEHFGYQI